MHRAPWPSSEPLRAAAGDADPTIVAAAGAALAALRKVKSEAKASMRTEIAQVTLVTPPALTAGVEAALDDVRAAGRVVGTLDLVAEEVESVVARDAELLPAPPKNR